MKKLYIIVLSLVMIFSFSIAMFGQDCVSFIPVQQNTQFVLVVDRSGSMAGDPLRDAKQAVINFINSMQPGDSAALITFEDQVRVDHNFSSDRVRLVQAVRGIETGGRTRFYDAVGAAARMLKGKSGRTAILFLTDGNDNESSFSLNNIRQMNIGEQNVVYGIGLGNVDHKGISALSTATGGQYRAARGSGELNSLYTELQNLYYTEHKAAVSTFGGYTVTSLPDNRKVYLDGTLVGSSPVNIDRIRPGEHVVQVEFDNGLWECRSQLQAGTKGFVTARSADLPGDFIIESSPRGAAVFIDDTYVGLTAMIPSAVVNGSLDLSGQLRVKAMPEGGHTVKIIVAPDVELSSSQVMEFDFDMRRVSRYVNVNVLAGKALFANGERKQRNMMSLIDSAFSDPIFND